MSPASPPASERLSRQILWKVLILGTIIVTVATVFCYFLVYDQSKEQTLSSLRQYLLERRDQENQTFLAAYDRLQFFREEFMRLYNSDIDFSDDDFWRVYFVDKDGAVRMKEEFFKQGYDPKLGRTWGVTSFIGKNQSVESHEFKRRLLLAYLLVNRYGPAWTSSGILHVTYPENAITIFSPDDPWGLNAKADLPMNELGTIKATLKSENPERKPVWTGLYYDETAGKWTITFEMPADLEWRHLINASMDVSLESIMRRIEADHPEGAYNFIVSKNGYLIAHPGKLKDELKQKGQISLEKLNDPDLTRMFGELTRQTGAKDDVLVVEDKEGGNYLLAASLAGPDWWFVMVYPKALISKAARQTSNIVLFLGFSLFVLYYFAVYLVIYKEVRIPLRRLQNAVSLVAAGEYEAVIKSPASLPLERPNEIGKLAGLFLDMCKEVSGVNANLHRLVEERTHELEDANAKLRDLSLLDGLTGMRNRRSFDRDIARVFSQAQNGQGTFSLLLADVDYFKNYNDRYGHTAGDEALRTVADAIAAAIRAGDRVYRYGGEEIAVIFDNATQESALQSGARILEAVRNRAIVHEGSPHGVLTLSAGVAAYDPSFTAAIALINAADANLYQAKAGGRNQLRSGPHP